MNDRRLRQQKRMDILAHLGGVCVKCDNCDHRVLQIDHVNGGGTAEAKKYSIHVRYKLIKLFPENYQLLCANCNLIKVWENDERAHKY